MEAKKRVEEPEEPSRAAGACVLVVLGGGAAAVVFAVSPEAGVLAVWVVGAVALWRAARRKSVQHAANPSPPPEEEPPSCGECAGQEPVTVTPRKGMLIYGYALPGRPTHTHVHLAQR
jgi:hypothetical protein